MTTIRNLLILAATALAAGASAFDVSAKSAIIIDADSGKVLWEKDADTPRYPASTTKIMTAMLLIERCLPTDVIVAPKNIEEVKEASLHLKPGEKISVKDMLYALMLRSANDGCVAVAEHISGSVQAFAKLMNDRAKELGCTHTNFNNPNGLNDPKHTISARDLATIARQAMKYDQFRAVVKTQKVTIERSSDSKDLLLTNHNKWLAKDATADGIKTGWTIPAGRCYVGSATRNGYRVITVVLKSEDWQVDHQNMLNWAFKNYDRTLYAKKGDTIAKAPIASGSLKEIPAKIKNEVFHIARKGTEPPVAIKTDYVPNLTAPITSGQEIGTVTLTDGTGWEVKSPLLAGADVAYVAASSGTTTTKAGFGILGGALLAGVIVLRVKNKRSRFYASRSSYF
ncbi:MAG: hypothetical protein BGO01_06495 [Armatimonadetes bacterium 55-13]|nr:D-alanyl-D-alanine carboxypeptidase [Armatimonadota bacterium]OJU65128.1 MAG: hypothetical protein BGO01_06495 [Armatimonadetes bacterium 55-13]